MIAAKSPLEEHLDWPTWLASINLFQIAVVIVALFVVARMLIRFWPWLRKVMELTGALAQLPEFIERTDRFITKADARIGEIHHETHKNDGSSIKDATLRIEEGVAGIYKRLDGLDQQVTDLANADAEQWKAIENTQPKGVLGPPKKEKPDVE